MAGAEPPRQLGEERARAAADVERVVARRHSRRIGVCGGERGTVAADVAAVRIRADGEGHAR